MFRGYSEVDVGLAVRCGIKGSLHQMLLQRGARTVAVGVELEQSFGQLAISQSVLVEEGMNNFAETVRSNELIGRSSIKNHARIVQSREESEVMQAVEEQAFEVRLWEVVVAVHELKEVLEHAGSRSTGGNELGDVVPFALVGLPRFDESLALGGGRREDAIADSGGRAQPQVGESLAELTQLILDLLFADALL